MTIFLLNINKYNEVNDLKEKIMPSKSNQFAYTKLGLAVMEIIFLAACGQETEAPKESPMIT